jgi:hypothetical protein
MIAKIKNFVKENKAELLITVSFISLSLLFFALGYIIAILLNKDYLSIEN